MACSPRRPGGRESKKSQRNCRWSPLGLSGPEAQHLIVWFEGLRGKVTLNQNHRGTYPTPLSKRRSVHVFLPRLRSPLSWRRRTGRGPLQRRAPFPPGTPAFSLCLLLCERVCTLNPNASSLYSDLTQSSRAYMYYIMFDTGSAPCKEGGREQQPLRPPAKFGY
jgi:hypothetical protein